MCLCYFTTSTNVFKNLATEEFFLKYFEKNILLFYCNTPSVVVGRNQNILKEVNVEFCDSNGLHIARRRSGGGCVYHDLGNVNVSLITSRRQFNKTQLLECIKNALQRGFHIPVRVSERNDLRLLDRKVAGSAYRITAERAYHHTTLLVHADLWKLEESLHHSEKLAIETKATQSIRSKVLNLTEYTGPLNIMDICRAIRKEWYSQNLQVVPEEDVKLFDNEPTGQLFSEIEKEYKYLNSIQWIWGEGPAYNLRCHLFFRWGYIDMSLRVEKGNRIVGVEIHSASGIPLHLRQIITQAVIGLSCLGKNYGEQFQDIATWFLRNLPTLS
ncbi:hypothetical protein GpartN1_g1033.t1 [Galdieria partita]|uniref:BPL/LPL catalytic domain-containing protein n=1 Tax=Galdieria partita TaxID=83374 RepID=A0A9C7PSP0_9RHOD|nr:hypothetical protein GpartN1_g1033.t1 [Galdieria partita]